MKQQDNDGQIDCRPNESVQTQSHKLREYLEYFAIEDYSSMKAHQDQLLRLLPSNLSYDRWSQFAQNLIVRLIRHSANFEIIELQVKIGYFLFHKISLLYAKREKSETHSQSDLKGSFSTVYKCQFKGAFLAFKCFRKRQTDENDDSILGRAIEEYCILKLASYFGVGPKIYDYFGYDIIVYPDCIEFCMELCSPLPKIEKLTRKRITKQLRENLLKLHSLSIIHFDIKVENIAFSNVFNKYVFIDFGMGRVVKEVIGFKSITTYKGTFNYCSEQMAQLYYLEAKTKRYIDVFFNDLFALKKISKNLEFRSQICDNQFYYADKNQQLQQNALSKDLTKAYRTNTLKYDIYLEKCASLIKTLKLLQPSEIEEIVIFIQAIKGTFFNKSMYKQFIKILRISSQSQKYLSENEKCHQLDYKQIVKVQINSEISKINKLCIVSLYLNQFHQKISQLIQILNNPLAIAAIELLDYFCLLAKVIQVNASTLILQELQKICELGKERLKEVKESLPKNGNQGNREENREEKNNIVFETSKTLFALAFHNKLIGKYFSVFCSIVNNIFFFELLSSEQLIGYYKVLLQMKMPFENKIVSLIKYNSALVWFYMGTSSQDIYQSLKRKIESMNEIYCFQASNSHKTEEIQVLKQILLKNKTKQLFISNTLGFCKETLLQIQMFFLFKKFGFQTISLKTSVKLFQKLRNLQHQLSFYSASVFQYYDFAFLQESICQQRPIFTLQIYSSLFLKKANAPFGYLVKNIIPFYVDRNVEIFTNSILNMNNHRHQFTIKIIFYLLANFNNFGNQLSKAKQKVKQLFFNLWIKINSLFLIQHPQPQSFQARVNSLTNQLSQQTFILRQYFDMTGQSLRIIIEREPNQIYLNLQEQLRKDVSKSNIRAKNNNLMKWNILGNTQHALRLAKIMLRLTNFMEFGSINKEYIYKFIFEHILICVNFQQLHQIKEQNKDIYLQYAKIIESQEKYLDLFTNVPRFFTIIITMYKFQPKGLFLIISKVLDILQTYDDRGNTLRIIQLFRWLTYFYKEKQFIETNNVLQREFKTVQNPYKIIVLYLIIQIKYRTQMSSGITNKDFFQIFSLLEKTNYTTKQYILRKIYFYFNLQFCNQTKQRKTNQINKKIIQHNLFSAKQMITTYISSKSMKLLKYQLNKTKLEMYFKMFDKISKNIYETISVEKIKIRINKGVINMIQLFACSQLY